MELVLYKYENENYYNKLENILTKIRNLNEINDEVKLGI
jgi:hypothetical protein